MFKAVSKKLKAVLPTLISSQQTAYVKNRFIGETGRLISDIIEVSDWLNVEGLILKKLFTLLIVIFLIPSWQNLGLANILSHG